MKRIFMMVMLATAQPGHAQPLIEDHAALDAAVVRFTGKPLGEVGGAAHPVDRRLRLARCPVPVVTSWYGNRQATAQISCPADQGWKLFVAILKPVEQQEAALETSVSRGDLVSVSVSGTGFMITRQGEALDSGSVGSWIRIKTDGKAQPMRAKIIAPGEVGMVLP